MRLRSYEVRAGGEPDATHRLPAFQLRGLGDERDADADREREDAAPWPSMPGFAVRPLVRRTLRALGVIDESDNVTLLALFDRAIAHADPVASGEARVYSPEAPAVHIRVGPVHIELRVEAAGEVRLGAGSAGYGGKSVGRVDDAVDAGTLYFVPGTGGAALTYSPPGGPPGVGTPVPLTGLKIAAGAPQVKA